RGPVTASEVQHLEPRGDSQRRDERLAALSHALRDASEVALFPECLVRIHRLRFLSSVQVRSDERRLYPGPPHDRRRHPLLVASARPRLSGWADSAVALPPDHDPDRLDALVPESPQTMRRRRVERDRVARTEVVLVEADADSESPADDVAVLPAAVGDERVGGAGLTAHVVRHEQELRARIALCGEPLPRYA